jgi:trk system potassium uptake protein
MHGGVPRVAWPHRRKISVLGAIRGYTSDPEFRAFMVIQATLIAIIAGYLAIKGHHTPGRVPHQGRIPVRLGGHDVGLHVY